MRDLPVAGAYNSVLFVCTGNIFRSVAAEYSLACLTRDGELVVTSAGTQANQGQGFASIYDYLQTKGGRKMVHAPRLLHSDHFMANRLVVAMSTDHQEFISQMFDCQSVLFNELCHGRTEPLLDLHEAIVDWQANTTAAWTYIRETIDYIWDSLATWVARDVRRVAL